MMLFNFARKVRRVARRQYRHGKLDRNSYQKIVAGSHDPKTVMRWQAAVEKVPGAPWLQKTKMRSRDWQNIFAVIWTWFIENWPAILKILLSLLMFVEPPKSEEKPEEESE